MRKKNPGLYFSFFATGGGLLTFILRRFLSFHVPINKSIGEEKKLGFFLLLRILLYLLPPSVRPPVRYAPDITKVVAVQHNGAKSEYLLASLSLSLLFSFFSPMEYTYLVKNADVAAALLPSPIHIPPFFFRKRKEWKSRN